MISSPFTANKKWLAQKWGELLKNELDVWKEWEARHWLDLDKLLEIYPNYHVYAIMMAYVHQVKREQNMRASWGGFINWTKEQSNIPSERMAKIQCLRKHYPNDDALVEAKMNLQTYEEAWFKDGAVTTKAKRVDELIDRYMRKIV